LLLPPLQSRRNRHANGHRRKLASLTDTRFLRPSWWSSLCLFCLDLDLQAVLDSRFR
jgi:hypothetical protein